MTQAEAKMLLEKKPERSGSLIVEALRSTLIGYAQVFFSKRWIVGLAFLLATFISPVHGLVGLAGLILANLFAWLLGMPREYIKNGYFAYNGLLQALALGLTYEMNQAFVLFLILISFVGVLVAAGVRSLFERFLAIPVLSLPFVLTTWLLIAAGSRFEGLVYTISHTGEDVLVSSFPGMLDFFASSLSAAFFQLSEPAGYLVLVGLLIYSRHALILAALGLASGTFTHLLLGGNLTDLNSMWIGFNFALTAIAVGGVWIVPDIRSFLLAFLSGAVCSVIAAGAAQVLNLLGLPILALPFVATTMIMLYALRSRLQTTSLEPIFIPAENPEANVKGTKNIRSRYVTHEVPAFHLPVIGEWVVTQGFNGNHTHKKLWAHAWDFEILDDESQAYENNGTELDDFFSFMKPVLSPADGKVMKVVNHIEDNPIGQVNQTDNWGNLVIIWHYGSVYSALCHLAQGSVKVEEGQVVHRGQEIGAVGNSGRSPKPHLHFQAQSSHEIGAPTISCELLHFVVREEDGEIYRTHDVPSLKQRIKPLEMDPTRFNTVSFPLGNKWYYEVSAKGQQWRESWETEIDFAGNRYLTCDEKKARCMLYVDKRVFMLLNYEGPKDTGLYWFFLSLPRMPITAADLRWKDELPGELTLSRLSRMIFDLAEPIVSLASLNTQSRFIEEEETCFSVETKLSEQGVLADKGKGRLKLVTRFDRIDGLTSMTAYEETEKRFELRQVAEN